MPEKILVVDDDAHMVQLVTMILRRANYEVLSATEAEDGLRLAYIHRPHLVLLDVLMPAMNGWEMCRRLREMCSVPIIFLTAMNSSRDVIKGLEMGADDYIVKPFHADELLARVRVHLRRAPKPDAINEMIFDDLTINFMRREVRVRGEIVNLTPREFDLLATLARNAERVMTRRELVVQAWGSEEGDAVEQLKLYILHLRRKIEKDPSRPERIVTSRGIGYRFNTNP